MEEPPLSVNGEVQATRMPRDETATWPVNDSCEVDYEEAQGRQGRQGAEMQVFVQHFACQDLVFRFISWFIHVYPSGGNLSPAVAALHDCP